MDCAKRNRKLTPCPPHGHRNGIQIGLLKRLAARCEISWPSGACCIETRIGPPIAAGANTPVDKDTGHSTTSVATLTFLSVLQRPLRRNVRVKATLEPYSS